MKVCEELEPLLEDPVQIPKVKALICDYGF